MLLLDLVPQTPESLASPKWHMRGVSGGKLHPQNVESGPI